MDILWTMFISSNSLFLLFITIEHFKKDLFSRRLQCALLKLAVFFSVFPMVFIKFAIQAIMDEFWPVRDPMFFKIEGKSPLIAKTPEALHTNMAFKLTYAVFILWLCVALFVFVRYVIILIKLKRTIVNSTSENVPEELLKIAEEQRKELNLRRKVELRVAKAELSPFTLGIFKPIVVIPAIKDLEKQKLLITHELYHIKRRDGLMKLIAMVSKTIYWFNPLSHKLYARLDLAMECSCDELVIKNMDKEKRKKYAFLIYDMAEFNLDYPAILTVSLSNDKEKLKERGELIVRNTKKTSKYAFFLSLGLILVSSFPIFASERVQIFSCNEEQYEFFLVEGEDDSVEFLLPGQQKRFAKIEYPVQFIDEDGNVYNVENIHTREACTNHNYVSGKVTKHIKNSDGSCEVRYYDGKRCSTCGHVVYGRLTDSEYHETCPH